MPRLTATARGTQTDAFQNQDWLLLGGCSIIWGASFLFIAVALRSFPPMLVMAGRIALGFLAVSMMPGVRKRIDRTDWPRFAFLGFVWMALPLALFAFAQQWISSALAGMLNAGTPIFAMTVGAILLRRFPRWIQIVGILIGTLGIVLISLPSFGEGGNSLIGVLMIMTANICYGLAINLAVPLQQKYGSLPTIWWTQLVALAMVFIPSLWFVPQIENVTLAPVLSLVALGTLGTGLAFVMATSLAGRVGGQRASIVTYFTTVIAMILGVVVLSEQLSVMEIVGAAVLLLGGWATSRRE